MSPTVLGALATAGILGITHALEPDHVAGISSLTGEYGDSRLSALVGACFSAGHVALVALWLVVAHFLLDWTAFPAILDAVGTAGAALVLGLLGASMVIGGLRRVVRVEEHDHGGLSHTHPHLELPGFDGSDHDHGTVAYLKTGVVGALFTLSPPVSMFVFAATLVPDLGASVVSLAVLTYAVAITATMSLFGASTGAVFGFLGSQSEAIHGGTLSVAGLAVVALSASLLIDVGPALA